jgi:PPOX class probable F420-dependent enzyme
VTVATPAAAELGAEERTFAEHHRVGHLATADAAGVPHVVPICYAVVGDEFYFVVDEKLKRSRRGLKRLRNIAANAQVALVIDQYDEKASLLLSIDTRDFSYNHRGGTSCQRKQG